MPRCLSLLARQRETRNRLRKHRGGNLKKLFIVGAGGHGKVVLDLARAMRSWEGVGFIDDSCVCEQREYCGCPVLGGRAEFLTLAARGYREFVIAIGNNAARSEYFSEARSWGFEAVILVHPSAVVSPSARVGAGTVIMPRAVLNAGAVVGEDCIINTGAIVEHDCRIEDHAHVSPGAVLGGGVTIGAYTHVGLNATVLPRVAIGERAVAGAGTVVLQTVRDGETVAGVPAKTLRRATNNEPSEDAGKAQSF